MRRVTSPERRAVALAGALVVLAAWNILVRPSVPSSGDRVGAGLLVAGLVVALGFWAGLDAADHGLARSRLASGLRWGGAAFGLVVLVILVGVALPTTHASFEVSRADVGTGDLLGQLLVTIPVGTVVVEELVFRGTLLALLLTLLPTVPAVLVCSAVFGLWHVDGVLRSTGGSALHVAGAVVGTFVATLAAGVAFCWLRLRSGSLAAPALAHLATNTVALAAAWVVVH